MCFDDAQSYDKMINWDVRLKREIPVIANFFEGGKVLDMACSSGRHSLALEKMDFSCIGVDLEDGFIEMANNLATDENASSKFIAADGTSPDLLFKIRELGVSYFDNALLLGNAIANMGSFDRCRAVMRNVFMLLRPGGKFFTQTVNRPEQLYYTPLRQVDGAILQRIMVPYIGDEGHNTELHVNLIEDLKYKKKETRNKFFMFTLEEFEILAREVGFNIEATYGGYDGEPVGDSGGSTVIWQLVKPEVELSEETLSLFAKSEGEIMERVLDIWQEIYQELPYRCIASMRFLHPRIVTHGKYSELELNNKSVLDLGCALGTDLVQLVRDGADPGRCSGIDNSAIALKNHEYLFGNTGIRLLQGNVADNMVLTLDGDEVRPYDDSYDIVFAGSLLHLLDEVEVRKLCGLVYTSLNKDGVFFGRVVVVKENTVPDPYFAHLHTIDSLTELLGNIGFVGIEMDIHGDAHGPCERSYGDHLTISFWAVKS